MTVTNVAPRSAPKPPTRLSGALVPGLLLALLLALPATGANAMGSQDDTPSASESGAATYARAKSAIDDGQYATGVTMLEKVVEAEPRNADAWNMLAYGNRKMGKLDAAHGQYMKALAIEPAHKGAHEYLGELYLQKGDLAKAEDVRAKLAQVCTGGCEELTKLDTQIAAFKAARTSPAWN